MRRLFVANKNTISMSRFKKSNLLKPKKFKPLSELLLALCQHGSKNNSMHFKKSIGNVFRR